MIAERQGNNCEEIMEKQGENIAKRPKMIAERRKSQPCCSSL
jgi:hypothetical protein